MDLNNSYAWEIAKEELPAVTHDVIGPSHDSNMKIHKSVSTFGEADSGGLAH